MVEDSSDHFGSVDFGANVGPYVGNASFAFEGTAPAPTSSGFLIFGGRGTDMALPVPFFLGRLYVELTTAIVLGVTSDAQAAIHVPVPIPNDPSLVHVMLFAQALMKRPNPGGPDLVGVSRGLELWLGVQ